jgi:hypothetical protein
MIEVPAATAVTTPVALTVAMAGALALHVPPAVAEDKVVDAPSVAIVVVPVIAAGAEGNGSIV